MRQQQQEIIMAQKHFANPSLGILGSPDPIWLWKNSISNLSSEILDSILEGNQKIVAPTVGQGTEIQALKEISTDWHKLKEKIIAIDKFCCFTNRIKYNYQIKTIWTDFLKLEFTGDKNMDNFKDTVWLMNPPYNDGSKANNPVYQHFIDKVVQFKPRAAVIIVQANWLMRDNKISNKIRKDLAKIGLRKMILNPVDAFPGASVRTVSLICENGYNGKITFEEASTKKSIELQNLDGLIPFCFDNDKKKLLEKLRLKTKPVKFSAGPKKGSSWQSYFIATAYQNFDIAGDPFGHIRILLPNTGEEFDPKKGASGYRIMAECKTKKEAEEKLSFVRSYWHSKLVTFIMKYRRTSYTLDNLQISWVPYLDPAKVYTDNEIYEMFNLSADEIALIESEFK
jgi:hypothetical protein